jgi:hypothetical protein
VSGETLADALLSSEPGQDAFSQSFTIDEEDVVLSVRRVVP